MEVPLERSHHFSGVGSSPESAIQICAYNTITDLHRRYSELNSSYTFGYFPFHVQPDTNAVLYPHPEHEDDLRSIRMFELTRALDVAFLCYASDLNSSRRRLGSLMARLENLHMCHPFHTSRLELPTIFMLLIFCLRDIYIPLSEESNMHLFPILTVICLSLS
jgi:hypothetical protein